MASLNLACNVTSEPRLTIHVYAHLLRGEMHRCVGVATCGQETGSLMTHFFKLHCVVKHSGRPVQITISFFCVVKNELSINISFPLIHLSPCSDLCRVEYDVLTSAYIDGVDVGKFVVPQGPAVMCSVLVIVGGGDGLFLLGGGGGGGVLFLIFVVDLSVCFFFSFFFFSLLVAVLFSSRSLSSFDSLHYV